MSKTSEANTIKEGKATIEQIGNTVFYNPAQITNRDLSIAVLREFARIRKEEIESGVLKPWKKAKIPKNAPMMPPFLSNHAEIQGLKVFEGLAASGLRALRYAMEVDEVGAVVSCDLDSTAVESMERHVKQNGAGAEKVHPVHADARLHMLQHPAFYDVIDLDPYGTPVMFLDAAVQSVSEGGLLCVTATDMAVLCGSNPEACYTKYGSISLKRGYCHEMAIRILLQCIDSHANRNKRRIIPVLSISLDFYIRVFVRVYTSAEAARYSPSKLAMIYQSTACDSFYFQPVCSLHSEAANGKNAKFSPSFASVPQRCPDSESKFTIGGPIWMDSIHDSNWVQSILVSIKNRSMDYSMHAKLTGLMTTISEELLDAPLYINLHVMCHTVHATVPKIDYFTSAIVEAGYRVSGTHCEPVAFKTDAPFSLLWDCIRAWVKEQPISRTHSPDSPIGRLLSKDIVHTIKFTNKPMSSSRRAGVTRFVQNPDNWGPRSRHGRKIKHGRGDQSPESTKHNVERDEDNSNSERRKKQKSSVPSS